MWALGIFAAVGAYVFGCYWCYAVIARFRNDVRELRQNDEWAARVSIIVIWAITGFIALILLGVGFMLAAVLIHELGRWR